MSPLGHTALETGKNLSTHYKPKTNNNKHLKTKLSDDDDIAVFCTFEYAYNNYCCQTSFSRLHSYSVVGNYL